MTCFSVLPISYKSDIVALIHIAMQLICLHGIINQLRLVYAQKQTQVSVTSSWANRSSAGALRIKVTQEPVPLEVSSPVISEGVREGNSALGIKCSSLEVMCVTSLHNPLARAGHMGPTHSGQEVQSSLCPADICLAAYVCHTLPFKAGRDFALFPLAVPVPWMIYIGT